MSADVATEVMPLTAANITVRFGGLVAVKDVSFTVPPASAVTPVRVAESWSVVPIGALDFESVVVIAGLALPTTTASSPQPELAALLLASPPYEAVHS